MVARCESSFLGRSLASKEDGSSAFFEVTSSAVDGDLGDAGAVKSRDHLMFR